MYNGEFFDNRQLIGTLMVNSTLLERSKQYMTGLHYDTMGIRVTGSPAFFDYGFIAEVVTIPMSPIGRQEFGRFHCSLARTNQSQLQLQKPK